MLSRLKISLTILISVLGYRCTWILRIIVRLPVICFVSPALNCLGSVLPAIEHYLKSVRSRVILSSELFGTSVLFQSYLRRRSRINRVVSGFLIARLVGWTTKLVLEMRAHLSRRKLLVLLVNAFSILIFLLQTIAKRVRDPPRLIIVNLVFKQFGIHSPFIDYTSIFELELSYFFVLLWDIFPVWYSLVVACWVTQFYFS